MHLGHYKVIERFKDEYEDFVIVVGSAAKSRTDRNPLDFEERKKILRACFPKLEIVGLKDEDRGEAGYPDWTERFIKKSGADIVISGNDLVQRLVRDYSDAEIVEPELYKPEECSGTEIRRRIREGEKWKSLIPECSREKTAGYEEIIAETR